MTLGQAKSAAMMLIDQYTPDNPPTDDEETLSKLNCLVELAQVCFARSRKRSGAACFWKARARWTRRRGC